MDREIGAIFQHRQLKLFDKESFTADFCQRRVEDDVAFGDHRHQLHTQARMRGHQALLDIMCLPERERTLSCSNSENFV